MLPAHFHDIFGQKYCGSLQRVRSKKYKSNLEEQATGNAELNMSNTRV